MLNEIEKYVRENLFQAYGAGNQTRISSGVRICGMLLLSSFILHLFLLLRQ